MNQLKGNSQSPIDFSTLKELLQYPVMMSMALLAGYPACCLMFSRSWKIYSMQKKSIFSAAMGSGYIVICWILIVYVGVTRPQYSNLIEGNEVVLTSALICLIAMIEVILLAILRFARIIRLRRKRKS